VEVEQVLDITLVLMELEELVVVEQAALLVVEVLLVVLVVEVL